MDFLKTKTILLDQYPIEIVFCLLSEEGRQKLEPYEAAKCIRENLSIYIYLDNPTIPIIVHELFHATEFIMEIIGQPLGSTPNETWAYLIEFLTKECLDFLK